MQRKTRFYRIQLLAYDLVNAPLWSLPLIGPSPTPMLLDEPSFHFMPRRGGGGETSLHAVRVPRKIQLLPTDDSL
jgi:hypothetical protein